MPSRKEPVCPSCATHRPARMPVQGNHPAVARGMVPCTEQEFPGCPRDSTWCFARPGHRRPERQVSWIPLFPGNHGCSSWQDGLRSVVGAVNRRRGTGRGGTFSVRSVGMQTGLGAFSCRRNCLGADRPVWKCDARIGGLTPDRPGLVTKYRIRVTNGGG